MSTQGSTKVVGGPGAPAKPSLDLSPERHCSCGGRLLCFVNCVGCPCLQGLAVVGWAGPGCDECTLTDKAVVIWSAPVGFGPSSERNLG